MAFKFVIVAFFIAAAYGSGVQPHGPLLYGGALTQGGLAHGAGLNAASALQGGDHSSFSYAVSDPRTGDVKDQHEKRVGDNVVGKYSLIESDGSKRIVEYQANPASGFNAIIRKEPSPYGAAAGLGSPSGYAGFNAPSVNLPFGHRTPFAHSSSIGTAPFAGPLAYPGAQAHVSPLGYTGNPALFRQSGLASPYAAGSPLGYGGYGNPLASSLGHGARAAPTVSHYSNTIVHDAPNPYAAYGGNGYGRGAYSHGWMTPVARNGLTNEAYGAPGLSW